MNAIADLAVTAFVTRSNLNPPLADLDLNDGANFVLAKSVRVGAVAWRREAATSPFVHGRIPVHETQDAAESSIEVYVLGGTHAALHTNLSTLLDAFTKQYTYELRLNVEGQSYHWNCERADYEVGFATETLNARLLPVSLSFYRHPTPVTGAF